MRATPQHTPLQASRYPRVLWNASDSTTSPRISSRWTNEGVQSQINCVQTAILLVRTDKGRHVLVSGDMNTGLHSFLPCQIELHRLVTNSREQCTDCLCSSLLSCSTSPVTITKSKTFWPSFVTIKFPNLCQWKSNNLDLLAANKTPVSSSTRAVCPFQWYFLP